MNDIRVQPQNTFHNYKGKKKSLPISINSNILPCQFIFSKPTSKIATSYINIGQKIQKSNHQKTKSINSNNIIMNPYIIMMNNNSRITNNSLIKTNQNLTSIINNNKKIDNSNSISNRDTFYHSRKKTPVYFKKSRQNSGVYCYNVSKNLSKNNSLLASKPIKKQTIKNFNFNNNPTYSNLVNLIKKSNYDEKDNNMNKRYITLNGNHKKNNKSCNNYTLNNKRMLSHENINIPINKKLENKENNINNNNLLNDKKSKSRDNTNRILKNNSSKEISGIQKVNVIHRKSNVPRADIKIDLNKILNEIKISKEQNEISNKTNSKNEINEINENKTLIKENNMINLDNLNKIALSEPNTSKIIIKEKEVINKSINELFNEENLYEIPLNFDDKFDDLNAIVRKIHFDQISSTKENLFSQNNKTYKNFKQIFDYDFESNNLNHIKNIYLSSNKEKNKITDRKNYNNLSFSTQSGSSYKKAFQNQNSMVSPISSKFNLNL